MRRRGLLIAATALPLPALAQGGGYPNRPIRLIAGSAPGGSIDAAARIIGPPLADRLGQPVVVENRGGAGGTLAFEPVARAPADGHALVLSFMGALVINPLVQPELGVAPFRDLAPVSLVVDVLTVLVVPEARPWRSLAELIAAARARPGSLSWGHVGLGSSQWLAATQLSRVAALETTAVPYRGGAPASLDLIAGRLDYMFSTTPVALPHVRAGRLRPLAVPTSQRIPIFPEVPTVAEAGFPGFDVRSWYGILTTAGTPRPVIERLNGALAEVMALPEVGRPLLEMGMSPMTSTPEGFLAQAETVRATFGPMALEAAKTER
ncbi:MAG: tripartite tricarboxylate transporter substrate binding protein [Acetobacteraceae bacterium]|nr:tripartite tricarboxylate transporter substrate binding protein [Acetobacteraceae bacterium]